MCVYKTSSSTLPDVGCILLLPSLALLPIATYTTGKLYTVYGGLYMGTTAVVMHVVKGMHAISNWSFNGWLLVCVGDSHC